MGTSPSSGCKRTFGNPNVGNPAPVAYNAALSDAGVDAVYVALEPDDIGSAMAAMRALKLSGGTITKPFKQAVMEHLDIIDDDATAIGAVNVVENRNGVLVGRNSDWIGAIEVLKATTEVKEKRVALLGAGGAARAIAFGLRSAAANTTIFNRTESKALELCETFGCEYGGPLDSIDAGFDIIVNATSIGMGSESGPCPISADALKNQPVVFDIIVRPKETAFLKLAATLGCATIPGTMMIAHLAVPTLEWLTGTRPSLSLLIEHFV